MDTKINDFTKKVLQAYSNIEDPRLKFIVAVLIKYLHACVQEMQPTDEEWEFAWDYMRRMAAITGLERNEFLLFGDIIGVSQLIETLNHEKPGQPVGYALVGPFLRAGAPFRERGASTASDATQGDRVRISGKVYDADTKTPIKGAILDTWQAATNGFYENQDDKQPDYNLRGRFKSDADGTFEVMGSCPPPTLLPRTALWVSFCVPPKDRLTGRRTSTLSFRPRVMRPSSLRSLSKGISASRMMSFLPPVRTWSGISRKKGTTSGLSMIFLSSPASRKCPKPLFQLRRALWKTSLN